MLFLCYSVLPSGIADAYDWLCMESPPFWIRVCVVVVSQSVAPRYIVEKYGSHPALHREAISGLPVIYLYDSYRTKATDWAKVFAKKGKYSVRGTPSDVFLIGLVVERKHLNDIRDSGFDGLYTWVSQLLTSQVTGFDAFCHAAALFT